MVYYDGFDMNDYMVINHIGRPILPPQTIYDKQILGRSGSYFFQKNHDPLTIPVDVTIYEDISMTYRELVRFLSGKLNKNKPKSLVFSDEPEMFIDGILEGSTDLDQIVKTGTGTINFYCPDPFYYANDDEIFTFTSTGSHNIEREKGNTESLPLIEIKGSNSEGKITVKTVNTKIVFDGKLQNDEILTLDSGYITSYIAKEDDTRVSANDDINTMRFPVLTVGGNNLTIQTEGGATVSEVKVYARSRWT